MPPKLSGGQQQRVAVARAVLAEPALVLADEPTANLDSAMAEALLDVMEKLNREKGTTFVFSTHDPRVMERAGRLIRLVDGCACQCSYHFSCAPTLQSTLSGGTGATNACAACGHSGGSRGHAGGYRTPDGER